jgi:formate hydrogenlyase subunit 3/multisubunit Na+/H+ antiporter MnhD subunit
MNTPETAVLVAIALCLVGAVATLLLARFRAVAGWTAFVITVTTAALVYWAIAHVLTAGPGQPVTFLRMPTLGFALRLHVDGLSAVFLGLAATVAVPASLYAIRYLDHYADYGLARYHPWFLVFLAAMYGLVSTTDMMWFFFIFWQMMTFPGYALIRFEHRKPENLRAANKYLLMMQIACAATMIGAELLVLGNPAPSGAESLKHDFDSISRGLPALLQAHPGLAAVAFGLFLVGFGIKMGMWPFGAVWLPDAHPAAPSPVSAMLSGVMIKTGVYGLLRYFLWLVPLEGRADFALHSWGLAIAGLGTLTLVFGTFQALAQEQSKRLLAFHSIGQVGYILLGIGTCFVLLPNPALAPLAALALTGALFHTVNHGVFKALLFLNAGSMLYATGTQNLNRLGGLMKYMPVTAVTALVASLSISGVPLFNGFASKWTLYVAGVQGGRTAPVLAVFTLFAILTSAVTLASFIKFFGGSFLSRTSSWVGQQAGKRPRLEVGWTLLIPQVALAVLCVSLGVFPAVAFRGIQGALAGSKQGLASTLAELLPADGSGWFGLRASEGRALFFPLALLLMLGLAYLLAVVLSRLGGAARRRTPAWLCGYARETDASRYGVHNFYGEIKRWSRWLGGSRPRVEPARGPERSPGRPEPVI